jgi:hypothetical protein
MWERSRGMRIAKIIGFGAIGLFIGLGLLNIIESGYFQRWKKLSTPPHNVSEYFSTDKEKNSPSPVKITKPCDYLSPEFSILSNSPQNILTAFNVQKSIPMVMAGLYSCLIIMGVSGSGHMLLRLTIHYRLGYAYQVQVYSSG